MALLSIVGGGNGLKTVGETGDIDSLWILDAGIWEDAGIWIDTENWNDGV